MAYGHANPLTSLGHPSLFPSLNRSIAAAAPRPFVPRRLSRHVCVYARPRQNPRFFERERGGIAVGGSSTIFHAIYWPWYSRAWQRRRVCVFFCVGARTERGMLAVSGTIRDRLFSRCIFVNGRESLAGFNSRARFSLVSNFGANGRALRFCEISNETISDEACSADNVDAQLGLFMFWLYQSCQYINKVQLCSEFSLNT